MTDRELDLLVLGSGVAGLSAAVRAAETHGMRVGVLTKGELAPGDHPVGPGRRRRGARRATPTRPTSTSPTRSRPAPGCATPTRCGCSSTRARPGQRADRPRRHVRPRRRRASSSWPARAATRSPASCTPAARPPAPRSSGRWSRRCGAPRRPCYEHSLRPRPARRGRPLPRASPPLDADGAVARGAGRPTCCRHRRRRPAVRGHHQPGRGHRRRHRHGAAGRRGRGRRRVRPVPPDRAAPPGDAAAAAVRGAARPRRAAARRRAASASSTSCCRATWCRRADDRAACSSRASTTCGSTPPASSDFAERFPTIAAALRRRSASTRPPTGCRSRRPRTTCAAASSPTSTAPRRCPGCGRRARRRASGVHGANRLASNSLLEGMVFGPRVVEAIDAGVDGAGADRRHARGARRSTRPGGIGGIGRRRPDAACRRCDAGRRPGQARGPSSSGR